MLDDHAWFACHETTVSDGTGERVITDASRLCAGSAALLAHSVADNLVLRLAALRQQAVPADAVADLVDPSLAAFVQRHADGGAREAAVTIPIRVPTPDDPLAMQSVTFLPDGAGLVLACGDVRYRPDGETIGCWSVVDGADVPVRDRLPVWLLHRLVAAWRRCVEEEDSHGD